MSERQTNQPCPHDTWISPPSGRDYCVACFIGREDKSRVRSLEGEIQRLETALSSKVNARDLIIRDLRALVDAATRFTWRGPGDYFAAVYDAETDLWLVEDRDGTVCGEHDERDDAVKQAMSLAAGTGAIVFPTKER